MIIGITGTDGAGKGTVVAYLQERGFYHVSGRALITQEIERRGMPINRDSMRIVGDDMRAQFGGGVLVKRAAQQAQQAGATNYIIESIRSAAEVPALRQLNGILLAVDADERTRYDRIFARGSETDQVTFAEFCALEAKEMDDSNPHGMQKKAVMSLADHTIMNNGTVEELEEQVAVWLRSLEK